MVDVQVRCAACSIPKYSKLDPDAVYAILTSEYMINGGDGFTMISDNLISRRRYGIVAFSVSHEIVYPFRIKIFQKSSNVSKYVISLKNCILIATL